MSSESPWNKSVSSKETRKTTKKEGFKKSTPKRSNRDDSSRTSSSAKGREDDRKTRPYKSPDKKYGDRPRNKPYQSRDDADKDRNNAKRSFTRSGSSSADKRSRYQNKGEFEEKPTVQKVANPLKTERKQGLAEVDVNGVVEVQGDRLQKVLAAHDFGSRREIEQVMLDGDVLVNNEIATLGLRVLGGEIVIFKGQEFTIPTIALNETEVLIYHKPVGQICSRQDSKGRPIVFDHIPKPKNGRWVMVGRLDINTSGLLIFTNNGALANTMMHPSNEVLRQYRVRVFGDIANDAVDKLKKGVELEDGLAHFDNCEYVAGRGGNRWYNVSLREGRNREVRRMWFAVGGTVSRLIRTAYGPIQLEDELKNGQSRWAKKDEMTALASLSGFDLDTAFIGDGSIHEITPKTIERIFDEDDDKPTKFQSRGSKSHKPGGNTAKRPYDKSHRKNERAYTKTKSKEGFKRKSNPNFNSKKTSSKDSPYKGPAKS